MSREAKADRKLPLEVQKGLPFIADKGYDSVAVKENLSRELGKVWKG